jgi:hypothetical protein
LGRKFVNVAAGAEICNPFSGLKDVGQHALAKAK